MRDDLREYVTGAFGDPEAVLVVDETGDLEKGTASVGVQRQYTGTAGRMENAQVAVHLTYATARGHVLIDRALYLPRGRVEDPERRVTAGVPEEVGFTTKPTVAADVITRAVTSGTPAGFEVLPESDDSTPATSGAHHVMIRRNPSTGELAFFRCYSPRPVGPPSLVRLAGTR